MPTVASTPRTTEVDSDDTALPDGFTGPIANARLGTFDQTSFFGDRFPNRVRNTPFAAASGMPHRAEIVIAGPA
jgi:hypothetical protein